MKRRNQKGTRKNRVGAALTMFGAALLAVAPNASAGLVITPNFDSSITGNGNAAAIEGAINSAIATIDGLFSNSVNIGVTFTYDPAAAGNLLSSDASYYCENYSTYVGQLITDSTANPANTVLASAIANLGTGNDSGGGSQMALAGAQLAMLGVSGKPGNAVININSNAAFVFSRPVSSGQFDAIGGLEHELDEVLGGGGGGSTSSIPARVPASALPTASSATNTGPTRSLPLLEPLDAEFHHELRRNFVPVGQRRPNPNRGIQSELGRRFRRLHSKRLGGRPTHSERV